MEHQVERAGISQFNKTSSVPGVIRDAAFTFLYSAERDVSCRITGKHPKRKDFGAPKATAPRLNAEEDC